MSVIQMECTCESCNQEWFYLPFEEMRMVMADIIRIRIRELGWREQHRYFGRPFVPGCRGCVPGCACLEGFACGEACGKLTCCRPGCLPGCGVLGIAMTTGPLSQWIHTLTQIYQIKHMPTIYRSCPKCGSGWFKKVIAVYEDDGKKRYEQSVSWQLPVLNFVHANPAVF
ncbi:hypothetical protein LSG31_11595 [Fodinisporobacter ferrooxydans]|uniref:Uncharacterized protein n=1 Tax=Fodinisporobacter ferrooxydans TaxID=2901836 RepID=A0ABY4CDH7_9BACL|nr:hypothetical protein LSG31_11595 [Alicyclobacillaceae bacterium MYW30-H2]